MKRHARTLLYALPLTVALCSLPVQQPPEPTPPVLAHAGPMAPR